MKKGLLYVLIIACLLSACKASKSEEEIREELKAEVIAEIIDEIKTKSTEGLEQNDSNKPLNNKNKDDMEQRKGVFDVGTMKIGDQIDEFTVSEVDYVKGDTIILGLTGEVELIGEIIGYYDDMYGENVFEFIATDYTFSKPIAYYLDKAYDYNRPSGYLISEHTLSEEEMAYILEGNTVSVSAIVNELHLQYKMYTEGGSSVSISNLKVLTKIKETKTELTHSKLLQFTNETIVNDEQGEYNVDYSANNLVIIPMHDSINDSLLERVNVTFNDEGPVLPIRIMGELKDVTVTYVANMGDTGELREIGPVVKDSLIEIQAEMPSDMSAIHLNGQYINEAGVLKEIHIVMDTMRDISQYNIITKR